MIFTVPVLRYGRFGDDQRRSLSSKPCGSKCRVVVSPLDNMKLIIGGDHFVGGVLRDFHLVVLRGA